MKLKPLISRSRPLAALAVSVLLVSLIAPSVLAQQTSAGEPDFAAIDRYVESERQAMRVPGLAIGIVQSDRIVHLAGFGQADPSGRPVTSQTPFLTASLNKSFTALAVMQLVEAGMVDLDAPVQRYIPWFRVADPDASARLTLRHLLNQTSGFPSFPASAGMVGGDMGEQAIERGVRALADVSLSRPVGSAYEYSNFNYFTLGMLVQAVSGQPYEEYLQQHVLGPLRMQRSYTSQADARPHGLATGYRFWFGVPMPADLTFSRKFAPSGGLISTTEDLAQYLVAQLNGGQYQGASVLSAAGIAEQHRPAISTGSSEAYYGMGWEVGSLDGMPVVHHNGTLANAYADLMLLPNQKLGVVVLANATGLSVLERLDGVARGVASMLSGRQPAAVTETRLFQALPFAGVVLVLVQIVALLHSVAVLRRWQARPESRPRGARMLIWHLWLPLAVNLGWASLILIAAPRFFGLPFAETVFILGDYAYVLAASALIALIWGVLRFWIAWRLLRATPPAPIETAETVAAAPAASTA
jgi:CubicO group peptidase (beta-lactamase class C family)